ncbi:NAD-dependent epimerase/dehydratase family protein [Herbiconiux sp. CPCC 203407]|uniref:NAD-dependent epimerase/dehydratase family protein n=1 Tax=Herbiconiux oxytropis TaxID=2970915 RepID=A0AA41XFN6_9MICO|nr:NAD-dependent epimerase/dehydratase family protein [Herbiconiux oxytropis]MCS5722025.1 NAD-dependent epimerase/dehydratase family protein [Herbiconiux oxytropis]MCS5725608.1 NAD-dependent epimerase/dehydratase family protein [Herbiconiux oxytropis]
MRVVITGGAGFIGANLCRAFSEAPAGVERPELVVLDDFSASHPSRLAGLPVRVIRGSVLDADALRRATEGADAVVHLAAVASVQESMENPLHVHEVNVTGTVAVLEAARHAGARHVVMASSSSVYGSSDALPKREDMLPRTESPYAAGKLAAESYALTWQRAYGLPVLALRFFNVFGPHQQPGTAYPAVVPAFLDAALAGRPLEVHGTGEQSRDFTYVASVCEVIADAVRRGVASDAPVDLGFGERTSLVELITLIEAALGRPLERRHTRARTGDVLHSQAEGARLAELFPGLRPVPLAEGLDETLRWLREASVE